MRTAITVLPSKRAHLDFRAGAVLWEKGTHWLVGAGVVFRIPG